MIVEYRKCDHCNAERRPHLCVGWWRLYNNDDFSYDFCSLACLAHWVNSRSLARFSVVQTTRAAS